MTTISGVDANGNVAASAAQARLTTDTQSFLRLLTAQLTNQDPLQPVDPTQWVTQLAQFSSVEQQVSSNNMLTQVLGELRIGSDRADMGYIGRTVEIVSNLVGVKGGQLDASYTVSAGASSVDVRLLDSDGNLVHSFTADKSAGTHAITWNGVKADGSIAADGTYTLAVEARNEKGDALESEVTYRSKVTRVRREEADTLFELENGATVGRYDIVSAA
ncbi:flagellar hook assembly protein FlgD [Niveispirillum sp. KHB5.9]|uniref:flagellar hook assembly protein FlgD n=1 Tax=Niveispirillum sp. KHB5.9 TaxID=3400269 RepID=UPI003A87354E